MIFEKIRETFRNIHRVVECDEDLEWNRAVYKCTTIVDEVEAEYNNGWIPCSVRLPDVEADVLLSLRSLDIYTGFRANTEGCFYVEGEGFKWTITGDTLLTNKLLLESYILNMRRPLIRNEAGTIC